MSNKKWTIEKISAMLSALVIASVKNDTVHIQKRLDNQEVINKEFRTDIKDINKTLKDVEKNQKGQSVKLELILKYLDNKKK